MVKGRIYFLVVLVLLFGFAIIYRLYYLQVVNYDFYKELAEDQHYVEKKIMPKRGSVYLNESGQLYPLATSRNLPTVIVNPNKINKSKAEEISKKLSNILQIDEEKIKGKITKEDDNYEVIKRKISEEEEKKIEKEKISGVHFKEESWRYYPNENTAAQLVGFVGYNEDSLEGLYGIEKYFEEKLKGEEGYLQQERDAGGRWLSIGKRKLVPARNGEDLVLTLDRAIQFKTDLILKNAVKKHDANGGSIIVLDPQSGKILAMSEQPSFDLNRYSEVEDIEIFRNSNISEPYECGSVFKAITMVAGLDSGKINFDTEYIDTGKVTEAGYTIKNSDFKSYGRQTMTEVIEKSLNTGAIFVEKQIGNELFRDYVKRFGFGEKTGISLPYESAGDISNLENNRNIEFFTASFGQGISVTPIQLAAAYGAIANGGELLTPRVVEAYINEKGEKTETVREVKRKIISKKAASQIGLMLESNVENGHGKLAGVPGYNIGGKTGTAQIPDKEKGGYVEDATIGTFAGFGPVANPKFVIVSIIDYPKDVEWAESSAGPVFGEMAKFLLDYYDIEPTEEFNEKDIEKFNKTHNYTNYYEEDPDEEENGEIKKEE